MSRARWLVFATAALAGAPVAAQQQLPGWAGAWSPLRPITTQLRHLPLGAAVDDWGFGLSPRSGLLWTAGNPAGLASDVTESRAWLGLSRSDQGGEYRRPLDPNGVGTWTLGGLGWRPLGRGAVAGRIAFDSRHASVATGTDVLAPYDADPFVMVDTSSPGRNSTHATLEGAAGWRFGGWHMGFSLGAELHRDRSQNTRFSRIGRSSVTGAMVGIGRRISPLDLTLALHGRWLGRRETHLLSTTPGGSTVFILFGYDEPDTIAVSPPGGLLRRTTADGFAAGAALQGRVGSVDWIAFVERGAWDAGHVFAVAVDNPATDRWKATATAMGLSGGVPLFDRVLLRLDARYDRLNGDARRADLQGVVFRIADSRLRLGGSLELLDPASPWQLALSLRGDQVKLDREDFLAGAPLHLTAWMSEAALAVGRHFGNGSAGVVVAAGLFTPAAAIPDPATLGPVYGTYLAPEQSLNAVAALPLSAGLWMRYRFSAGVAAYLQALGGRTAARGVLPPIPFLPTGDRHQTRITAGIELTSIT
jgi:hypothetical protein